MLKLLVANTQIASATRGNVALARLFVQHCSALKPSRPGRPERLATRPRQEILYKCELFPWPNDALDIRDIIDVTQLAVHLSRAYT